MAAKKKASKTRFTQRITSAARKLVSKKTTTKRKTVRKTAAKRTVAKRTTAKKRVATARRTATKRPAKRKTVAKKATAKRTVARKRVGVISHYFSNIGVAVIETSGRIQKGDRVSIEGATTNFKQKVGSMQYDHKKIEVANRGRSVGVRVNHRVRRKDLVYKIG